MASREPGTDVTSVPTVWVSDSSGVVPIPGVLVTFSITAGGGTLGTSSALTDETGIATVRSWRLGDSAGVNTIVASAAGLAPVVFTATALAGVVARFDLESIGGYPLPVRYVTGGRYVLYDDGSCTWAKEGAFGNFVYQCVYTLTGNLDDRASLAFFFAGQQFATGTSIAGVMSLTYVDAEDSEDTEVYRRSK
jgi:hypothetical protein